ncbi:MAG: nucleoside triphosphate pyrophosphohydrolase [Marinifilaceae bacterium]
MERKEAFSRLLDIMDQLRVECPWDRKQTMETLRSLTIEETYELSDAICEGDMPEIKKELGDILLHIVFYAKIATEQNAFDIKDVIDSLCEKLIYRHPHIFSDVKVKDEKEVAKNWEQLKLKEKGRDKRVMGGVPKTMPSLIKAMRIQDKARGVGFDWDEKEQVWDKVDEEILELKAEFKSGNIQKMEDEFGDVMFSLVNAARLYDINPDDALESTNRKFLKRFSYLEEKVLADGKNIKDLSLTEMDKLWEEAKKI